MIFLKERSVISRRRFMASCVAVATLPALVQSQTNKEYRWTPADVTTLDQALAELEHSSQGRLGVSVLDTGSGQTVSYRVGPEIFISTVRDCFTSPEAPVVLNCGSG